MKPLETKIEQVQNHSADQESGIDVKIPIHLRRREEEAEEAAESDSLRRKQVSRNQPLQF